MQEAENLAITSTSGKLPTFFSKRTSTIYLIEREYVERMKESTQLLDLLATVGSEDLETTKATAGQQLKRFILMYVSLLYNAYFGSRLLAGELHQLEGHFSANQYNYLEGSVPFTKPVLLIGRENMNRVNGGDVVVIEIFDKKESTNDSEMTKFS